MIVVTGGLGFIGNELVRQLIQAGEKVAVIDNRNRVAPHIEDLSGVEVYEADIINKERIKEIFISIQPHTVYHLAAIHYIPECNANPERTLRINVEGTESVLNAAAAAGVGKFIFASSGAVYADSAEKLTESSEISPVDIYGWSKLFGEQLCLLNFQVNKTPTVICRLFNNYGPRETNMHIIPEVLYQLSMGNTLQLGNITTTRDYIHTKDCATAMIKLAACTGSDVKTVNVAHGNGYTVKEMIDRISEISGRVVSVTADDSRVRKVDKQTQVANIELLHALTGWRPQTSIQKGLKELLEFENSLKIVAS